MTADPRNPAEHAALARLARLDTLAWRLRREGDQAGHAAALAERAEAERAVAYLLLPYVSQDGWHERYPGLLCDGFTIRIGQGWEHLARQALDVLAGEQFPVSRLDESKARLRVSYAPTWRSMEHLRAVGAALDAVREASARTCDACGMAGTLRRHGRGAVRCEEHAWLVA